MRTKFVIYFSICLLMASLSPAQANMVSSETVIEQQQLIYTKQQLSDLVDSEAVQQKLVSLGVSPVDAKMRIANMTNMELAEFQKQMDELPAGQGVAGVIVTVLLVIAVLDILGVTDVYPFIKPVN